MNLIPLNDGIYYYMNIIITESQYKRLISENFQQEKELILDLLNEHDFDGVIRFEISKDDNFDRVDTVFAVFDLDWLSWLDYDLKNRAIFVIKTKIRDTIKKYLGLDNIYIGSYFERKESL